MESHHVQPSATPQRPSARQRILNVAMQRFASDGFAGTSVRALADAAAVSPALILHHFGSKDGLIAACTAEVTASIRASKLAAFAAGPELDALDVLRGAGDNGHRLRYLARLLVEEATHVEDLIDEMVADAEQALEAGIASGSLKPVEDVHGVATVLTIWSLGAVMLHEQVSRLLGADLTESAEGIMAYGRPAATVLAGGMFADAVAQRLLEDDH